jgi:hypothetical protein
MQRLYLDYELVKGYEFYLAWFPAAEVLHSQLIRPSTFCISLWLERTAHDYGRRMGCFGEF